MKRATIQDLISTADALSAILYDDRSPKQETIIQLRQIRRNLGEDLRAETNAECIAAGYRDDAVDGLAGLAKFLITKDEFTDGDLQQARLALTLAIGRIGKYFRAVNGQKPGAAGIEPAAIHHQGGRA